MLTFPSNCATSSDYPIANYCGNCEVLIPIYRGVSNGNIASIYSAYELI